MLLQLPHHIENILLKIKSCSNIEQAKSYFDILNDAQGVISITISEDIIELPDTLWKLYKDFDRIDDMEWREYLFKKIKLDNYSLAGEPALDDWFPKK